MKNVRKSIVLILILSMLLSLISVVTNKSYAAGMTKSIVKEKTDTKYGFNSKDIQVWSARTGSGLTDDSATDDKFPFTPIKVTDEKIKNKDIIELKTIVLSDGIVELTDDNNKLDASDAESVLRNGT